MPRVFRFVVLALLVALLLLAVAEVAARAVVPVSTASLAESGLAPGALPAPLRLGAWILDAAALTVLVLLLSGRGRWWWFEGLAAGLLAWVYRGPLATLSTLAIARVPKEPFWQAARTELVVLPLVGLVLGGLAARLLPRSDI